MGKRISRGSVRVSAKNGHRPQVLEQLAEVFPVTFRFTTDVIAARRFRFLPDPEYRARGAEGKRSYAAVVSAESSKSVDREVESQTVPFTTLLC